MIRCYDDFINALLTAGFSMGIGDAGIYAVVPWSFFDEPPYDTPVNWGSSDQDLSPWEWRMRVLVERSDIAYGKFFFNKTGYITREWYPYFLAARRGGISFDEAYENGTISHLAKRVYDVIRENGMISSRAIKQLSGFSKDEKAAFERALVELQMKFFITMGGSSKRISQKGESYGMTSMMFCTTEFFWNAQDLPPDLPDFLRVESTDNDIFEKAAKIGRDEAFEKIRERVLELNSVADEKNMRKFVFG